MGAPRRQCSTLGVGASERRQISGLSLKELVDTKQRSAICFRNFLSFRMRKDIAFYTNYANLRLKEENQAYVECSAKIKLLFQIAPTLIQSVKCKCYMYLLSLPF